jgi:hypothetical protein
MAFQIEQESYDAYSLLELIAMAENGEADCVNSTWHR